MVIAAETEDDVRNDSDPAESQSNDSAPDKKSRKTRGKRKAQSEDGSAQAASSSKRGRRRNALPSEMATIVLEGMIPFPGPIAPILLDSPVRSEAVLCARRTHGHFLLLNRRMGATEGLGEEGSTLDLEEQDGLSQASEALELESHYVVDDGEARIVVTTAAEEEDERDEAEAAHAAHAASNHGMGGGLDSRAVTLLREAEEVSDAELLGAERSQDLSDADVRKADKKNEAAASDRSSEVDMDDFEPIGIVARIVKVIRLPDDRVSALVQLVTRAEVLECGGPAVSPIVSVRYPEDKGRKDRRRRALMRQLRMHLKSFFDAHSGISEDMKIAALSLEYDGNLADFVAQHLSRTHAERRSFLRAVDVRDRLELALEVALRELDLLTVGNRISQEIRDKVEKHQREFLLREQLKSIRGELGEEKDPTAMAVKEIREALAKRTLPEAAQARADQELRRLEMLPSESPEFNMVRTYLETLAALPWGVFIEEKQDLVDARAVLDADHHGLEEVKDRIVEFLAVRQLNPSAGGSLLCFAGPPGVGKTSLGESIARALGRSFYRFSVGGMRDEAEIKGHRRTYVGAMPGRILQGLRQAKSANPVILLDEIDKMGSDWRGDPSSALLEVLDSAQNHDFSDHYLEIPFDLSRVMFIATANVKGAIPDALRDRLEIIDLPGYIPEEKLEIAHQHLVPRQRKAHGLKPAQLRIGKPVLKRLIREYTHEAGVRELQRMIASLCRKQAVSVVTGSVQKGSLKADDLVEILGPPTHHDDPLNRLHSPGVALGLAWTSAGGEVLTIEAAAMAGKGRIRVTGRLGEVMSESVQLAMSYVRSQAQDLGLESKILDVLDLHIHFPSGAVPKDGPSAGVTIATAIVSLLAQTIPKRRLAMTGELTLRGEVLPVGGIREKVVAARRVGVRTVVLPASNRADAEKIPEEVRERLSFVYAESFDDVLAEVFGDKAVLRKSMTTALRHWRALDTGSAQENKSDRAHERKDKISLIEASQPLAARDRLACNQN